MASSIPGESDVTPNLIIDHVTRDTLKADVAGILSAWADRLALYQEPQSQDRWASFMTNACLSRRSHGAERLVEAGFATSHALNMSNVEYEKTPLSRKRVGLERIKRR